MTHTSEPAFRIKVDPTNPGQFFACCGLLELADRLWGGAEGWFEGFGDNFGIRPMNTNVPYNQDILDILHICAITNTMHSEQLRRREELSRMKKKEIEASPSLEADKKTLDRMWREMPLLLHEPFSLRIDWFCDKRSGGSEFKTWAGKQSVIDIANGMKNLIASDKRSSVASQEWLSIDATSDYIPFYFDSDLGGVGSDRDVGFSFDPLKNIRMKTRPFIEFAAFVGLQRFRPREANRDKYRYSLWFDPLVPEIAAAAVSEAMGNTNNRTIEH